MNWHSVGWAGRVVSKAIGIAVLVVAPVMGAGAQRSGDGFLFHKPTGTFTLRAGYSLASATSDVFSLQQRNLTIGPRGFDALSLGGDLSFNATPRIDLGLTMDGTIRSHGSEYRGWEGSDSTPIRQTTSLGTFNMSANIKYNFRDRGRAISNFAWIPTQVVPYVGIGAGVMRYDFRQKGDFVDTSTAVINSDELSSGGWTSMAQAFSGISYTISPRVSLISEARYTYAWAVMNKDYADLGRIDLSGLSLNFGTSFRF